jgi:hypothetical protein
MPQTGPAASADAVKPKPKPTTDAAVTTKSAANFLNKTFSFDYPMHDPIRRR